MTVVVEWRKGWLLLSKRRERERERKKKEAT
jgi:hypothetical protein